MQFNLSFLAFSVLAIMATASHAQSESDLEQPSGNQLPTITTQAETDEKPYAAKTASEVLRSDAALFETAQSISVITNQQIEQKQAKTVAEALEGVAGVTSGQYGRRGWDDFIIRGQISSSQTYIDGLRVQASDNILRAEDISGLESIEVVKGPTSVGFGLALPGGLVNLTTKRPQAETSYKGALSYGSYGLKEGTFDMNYAPNQSAKGAFRVVGRVSDQDDPTDHVYFKNQYIAPSYNFDLGDKDDLSVIASYQHREYIRQQGIPYSKGSYQNYSSSLFFGEPGYGYDVDVYRIGANYAHYFDNDWTFKQNLAVTKTDTKGNAILASGTNTLPTIKRAINNQDKQDINYTLDNHLQRNFDFEKINYDVMVGVDMMRERSDYYRRTDTINSFNADNPVYGITSTKLGTPTQELTYSQYAGLYLHNTIKIDDDWIIGLSGRHDWTQVEIDNVLKNTSTKNSDNAFTGSASVMYRINDMFAPYISYSTSFMPVTDAGENGTLLNPEEGKQAEVGVKFQALDQRLQGYVAYYDLTRKNVTESDASGNFSIQTGEQVTKGFEAEMAAALTEQWNVAATYSYIPTAKITESVTASEIGKRSNHVPKNASSLSTEYYFSPDQFGWNIGAGIRYQDSRTAQRSTDFVYLPSYTLVDVNAGYETKSWAAGLSIKNLFDKEYLAGTTPNAQLVNWGDPMMVRFNVKFKY
ncbi:TonB-dependent siderophore receptor [Acinetobacter bohemicus]|uniref:Iron complex outermembrane recepter protein n=1 Tax=Acinetobacter bohemicus TaxID=1435036 RepID=A0A1I6VAW1_9GAMM|nr:TonB-dependent siderophore receptor [Acinetobacter bohemicus]KAB0651572.1 TonB-dependent siderophore receptor [Acinetobacter bohemicus]SFT10878.1 iron complex outermembrane recepter protein [Acinetobacter bohemicus]